LSDSIVQHRLDIEINSDSLTAHRTDINTNLDSIIALRTDINLNSDSIRRALDSIPIVSTTNQSILGAIDTTYITPQKLLQVLELMIKSETVRETPTGTKNGTNPTFTLTETPYFGTETVYLNGQMLTYSVDYTMSNDTITMNYPPESGDAFLVNYKY